MSGSRLPGLAVAAVALGLPLTAGAATQQILLPGPMPYPTQSPPLVTGNAPPSVLLPFRVTARADERVAVGVDREGQVVALRVRHRLVLWGKGDYQIVIGAPVEDVRAAPSDSQPGLRTGQILWAGFSPGRKVLAADAQLRPGAAAPFLPLRLRARRDSDRYSLTVTNATEISEIAYAGTGVRPELAALLDRTRRESLAGARLSTAYATILGPVRHRDEAARIAAPFRVEGKLRFPRPPAAVRGGMLHGTTVAFSATLGDHGPLSLTVGVRGGGMSRLRLTARPAPVARGLVPPGAPTWRAAARRRRLPVRGLRPADRHPHAARPRRPVPELPRQPRCVGTKPHGLRLRDDRRPGTAGLCRDFGIELGGRKRSPRRARDRRRGARGRRRGRRLGPQLGRTAGTSRDSANPRGVADMPDYLVLRRHRDLAGRTWHPWVRRALVVLLLLIAVLGVLNVFGQRPSTASAVAAEAGLKVDSPTSVRGGLIFEARFHVTARRDLKDAILVLGSGWLEGMTVNTIVPSPVNEASKSGRLSLELGHIPAGQSYVLYVQFQVNPTNVGHRSETVELDDRNEEILSLRRSITIYP